MDSIGPISAASHRVAGGKSTWILSETKLRASFLASRLPKGFRCLTFGEGVRGLLAADDDPTSDQTIVSIEKLLFLLRTVAAKPGHFPRLHERIAAGESHHPSFILSKAARTEINSWLLFFESFRLNDRNDALLSSILDEQGNPLPAKERVAELLELLPHYEEYLRGQQCPDGPMRLEMLIAKYGGAERGRLKGLVPAAIVLDQPTLLFPLERRALAAVARHSSLIVVTDERVAAAAKGRDNIPFERPGDLPPSFRALDSVAAFISEYRSSLDTVIGLPPFNETRAALAEELLDPLSFPSLHQSGDSGVGTSPWTGIVVLRATDRTAEVALAAKQIAALPETGHPRLIHLVSPEIDRYQGLLRTEFRRAGIPLLIPKGELIRSTALGGYFLSLLRYIERPSLTCVEALFTHPLFRALGSAEQDREDLLLRCDEHFSEFPEPIPCLETVRAAIHGGETIDIVHLADFARENGVPEELFDIGEFEQRFAAALFRSRRTELLHALRRGQGLPPAAPFAVLLRTMAALRRWHSEVQRELNGGEGRLAHVVRKLAVSNRRRLSSLRREAGFSSDPIELGMEVRQFVRVARTIRAELRSLNEGFLLLGPEAGELSPRLLIEQLIEARSPGDLLPSADRTLVVATDLLDARALRGHVCIGLGFTMASFPVVPSEALFQPDLAALSRSLVQRSIRGLEVFESNYIFSQLVTQPENVLLLTPERDETDMVPPAELLVELSRRLPPDSTAAAIERLQSVPSFCSRRDAGHASRTRRLLYGRIGPALTAFDGKLVSEESRRQAAQLLAARSEDGELLQDQVHYGVRELETLFDCAHRFYFTRLLGLKKREDSFDSKLSRASGNVVHDVLDHAAREGLLSQSALRNNGERVFERVRTLASEALASAGVDWDQDPFSRQMRDEIIAGLESVEDTGKRGFLKAALLIQRDLMTTEPTRTEVSFGGARDPFVLERNGRRIHLTGVIDRIDLVGEGSRKEGEPQTFAVWDYKTGEATAPASVINAETFQVPLYALASRHKLGGGSYAVRGGEIALHQPRRIDLQLTHPAKGAVREHLTLARKGNPYVIDQGVVEQRIASSVDTLFSLDSKVREGHFGQRLETAHCEYCDFRRICARDEVRLRQKLVELCEEYDEPSAELPNEMSGVAELLGASLRDDVRESKNRTLSDEQQVASDVERSIALSAGAGSGKTFVLMTRVLRLLKRGVDIESIVAITFTNKAANELRDRIEQTITRSVEQRSFEGEELTEEQLRYLSEARARLPYALFGTIHSLASSVIALDRDLAGVGHYQRILSAPERQELIGTAVEQLLRRTDLDPALHGTVDDLLASGLGRRELLKNMIRVVSGRKEFRAVTEGLLSAGVGEDEILAELGRKYMHAVTRRVRGITAFIATWERDAWNWWQGYQPTAKMDQDKREGWARLFEEVRAFLGGGLFGGGEGFASLEEVNAIIIRITELSSFLSASPFGVRRNAKTGVPNYWNDLRDRLGPESKYLNEVRFNPARERGALRLAARLAAVTAAIGRELSEEKKRLELIDNDDLIEAAHRLLVGKGEKDEAPVRERRELVLRRLGSRINHLLIDEFQDTDSEQLEILRSLITAASLYGEGAPTFFMVGDCQQSIYAFRGSDVTVFRAGTELVKALDPHGRDCSLSDNYRSAPQVVQFVNELFSELFALDFDSDGTPLLASAIHAAPMRPARRPDDEHPRVSVLRPVEHELEEGMKLDKQEAEAMTVASFISGLFLPENRQRFPRLFADPSLPQIAVLCRTAKQLAAIAQALDEIDVPFRRAQRSGFYDRVEIQAVETILKALADPGDSLALIGALRTPFIGLSDEDLLGFATVQGTDRFAEAVSMITRLRRRAAVIPISSVIDELVERCGFAASAREVGDEEAASSIGGLLALLRDGELKGVLDGSPSAAFRWLALQRDADRPDTPPRSGSPEAVELLTMHGAKGLEFPMVILPFLAPQTARGPRSGLVVGDLPLPDGRRVSALGLKLEVAEDGFRRRPTYLQQLLTESDQEAVAAEERRVFYVACTRAREYLVLSGGGASGLGSDVAPSRDAARASRSPRDWLAWFESMRGEGIPRIAPWT